MKMSQENTEFEKKTIDEETTDTNENENQVKTSEDVEVSADFESNTQPAEISTEQKTEGAYHWSFESQVSFDKIERKKSGRKGALVYAIIVTSLFAVCFAILAALLLFGYTNGFGEVKTVYTDRIVYVREDAASSGMLSTQEIAAKVIPSTVGVSVSKKTGTGTGTGIVLDKEGYIVTNHHVIDGALSILVVMSDSTEFEAVLIGSDANSDIAVLKINPGKYELSPAAFADSSNVLVGDSVVAIGNAGGLELFGTVTKGVISGTNRDIPFYKEEGLVDHWMTLIQTDALINPGNSGGPLVNMYGEVIGINFMKYVDDSFEGLGFAIPSNDASIIAAAIIDHGYYEGEAGAKNAKLLGIQGGYLYEGTYYKDLDITPAVSGVYVSSVATENSYAYGYLEVGDIITHINGNAITSVQDIRNIVNAKRYVTSVTLTVYRNGETLTIEIPLT